MSAQLNRKKLVGSLALLMLVLAGQYVTIAGQTAGAVNGHIIVVTLDEKGKPQYNITSLAELLAKYNVTAPPHNATCSCCANRTAPAAANVAVKVNVVANETWSHGDINYTFFFAGVTATNGTANYTVYVLLYRAIGSQGSGHYNFSVTTFILTKPNGEYAVFLTKIDVEPFKKNVTATEYVVIKNATTLADSYRLIAKALQQVKSDSPKAWDIAHKELTHLAKLVEKEIPQYNKKAPTVAQVMDTYVCALPIPTTPFCMMLDCIQPSSIFDAVYNCCVTIVGFAAICATSCLSGPSNCAQCFAGYLLGLPSFVRQCQASCPHLNLCIFLGCWGINLLCVPLW